MSEKIRCTTPGCRASRRPEIMWVAEPKTRRRSNNGNMVGIVKLKDFAVCESCARKLRRKGKKRFMRYTEALEWERDVDFHRDVARSVSEDLRSFLRDAI